MGSRARGEVKFRGEWMLVQAMSRQRRPFRCRNHGGMSGASRNRVGTVGTALETGVDTVVNHVETVNSISERFKCNHLNDEVTVSM